MSKRYRDRHNKPHTQPIQNYSIEDQEPSYTHDPLTSGASTSNWNVGKSTTASSTDDSDDEELSAAPNNWPSFATKFLQGRIGFKPFMFISTTTLVWLGVNLWILIQDNSHQYLQSTNGWIMYGNKVAVSSAIYLIALIIPGINWWLFIVQRRKR